MKAPGAILALALGKGKDGESEKEESSEPAAEQSGSEEYKELFVEAAKAGDWESAFDAVKQCLMAKE